MCKYKNQYNIIKMDIWLNTLIENIENPHAERFNWIKKNINLYPQIKIVPSIDGRKEDEVKTALKASGLELNHLHYKTYGTLAVFLTKFLAWEKQIKENVPYLCLLEDDLELNIEFLPFIEKQKDLLNDTSVNLLRVAEFGECYITSLDSAKRLIKKIKEDGILMNVDEQMRVSGEKIINHTKRPYPNAFDWNNSVWTHYGYEHDIFKLLKPTNGGVPLKTREVEESLSDVFFIGGFFDMDKTCVTNILTNSNGEKYIAFGIGGAGIKLLKMSKPNQSLTVYEVGNNYNSYIKYKNYYAIPDKKLKVLDFAKGDINLLRDFDAKYGNHLEEANHRLMFDMIKFDYTQYDVYILDSILRGQIAMFALHFNPHCEVFIHDADRDWYNWLKNDSVEITEISKNIIRLVNKV